MLCRLERTILIAIITAAAIRCGADDAIAPAETRPLRVALFADPGSTDGKSREAIYKLLSGRNDITVEKVTTETVRAADFLTEHDVFILPGGTGSGEASAIGEEAGKRIAERIRGGKGLIAICAGGYYIAEGGSPASRALDVVAARNHDGEHWARGEAFITVEMLGEADEATSRTMWYENGPLFKPATGYSLPGYIPLVRYVSDMAADGAPTGQMAGRDAVIAAPVGEGRVVAFGPHPELSPEVNHWLINAIKWSAGQIGPTGEIDAARVLEGRE